MQLSEPLSEAKPTRKESTVSDHEWLDNIIHTGELPPTLGKRNNLRAQITSASEQIMALVPASSHRAGPGESASSADCGSDVDSTRPPHVHGITGIAGGEVLD